MKIIHTKDKGAFQPVTISLTCESQAEVNAICGIFNSAMIMNVVRKVYDLPELKPYLSLEGLGAHKIYELHEALRESIR